MNKKDLTGEVQTVLGAVDGECLGITSTHEHIIWDMSTYFEEPAAASGLQLIFLLAPTSTRERRSYVVRRSHGFVYYVSLTGITGAKLSNLADVGANVAKIRKISSIPVAVGFGVATPEDAAKVAAIADGVIVGSAIVKQIATHQQNSGMVTQVGSFVKSLKAAMVSSVKPTARVNSFK